MFSYTKLINFDLKMSKYVSRGLMLLYIHKLTCMQTAVFYFQKYTQQICLLLLRSVCNRSVHYAPLITVTLQQ